MMKPTDNAKSLADMFEALDDDVPVTEGEAKVILADAGLDASASLRRLFSKLDAHQAQEQRERFAKAEAGRKAALRRLEAPKASLPRADVLAQLNAMRSKHPALSAHFRNFERMTDDDLRSLLNEIEELVRRGENE